MNPTIEELYRLSLEDPLPADHTSSHWQLHGEQTVIERVGSNLVMNSSGFGGMHASKKKQAQIARGLERLSYWPVTTKLRSYSQVLSTTRSLAQDISIDLTTNVWKQVVALAVLMDHWKEHNLSPRTFALIGDGHALLGALIKRHFPESRIYQIDLPKILVFQAHTHDLANSGTMVSLTASECWRDIAGVFFVAPQHVEVIPENIDCAVNMASMGEMSESSISSYFTFLRGRSSPASRFYCVNRVEKQLPGGEMTRFYEYPWTPGDYIYIDEPCPYYTHVFESRTAPNGPRILGVRVPFINYFGGTMAHRLAHLAPLISNLDQA